MTIPSTLRNTIISLSILLILALIGVYYVSKESAVSQIETHQSSAFGISRIYNAKPFQDTSKKEDRYTGFMAFSKMFAREEANEGYSNHSLLGPKGSYDEIYIGKK